MNELIKNTEEKMEKSIKYEEKNLTYRELIFYQAEKYKKMIMNKDEIYLPFRYK